jgi:preprotein translocase subunit SecD
MKRILTVFFANIFVLVGCQTQIDLTQFEISSQDVKSAKIENNFGSYKVDVTLTDVASQRLTKISKENLGKKLPLIVNDKIVSEPLVRQEITGPKFSITCKEKEEAEQILKALKK